MPYKLQLADAQADIGLRNVCGCNTASPQFTALINEGTKRLIRRGEWFGQTQQAVFVFQGSSVTWPRYVGTTLGCRTQHHRGIRPRNMWYSFTGSFHNHHHAWHSDLVLEDAGEACTYNDITGTGQILQFNVDKAEDIGKTITIYGLDNNEQRLQQKVNGVWVDGMTLTAASPYVRSSTSVSWIESIVKQPMQGYSRLYQYDPVTNPTAPLNDLAIFEPNETNPTYRRSRILNYCNRWNQPNGSTTPLYNQMEVLVSMAFIPVASPLDFLMIDQLEVLKLAVQAIKAEEAEDTQTSELKWTQAIRELNFEDRKKMPDNMTSIYVNATLARCLNNPN